MSTGCDSDPLFQQKTEACFGGNSNGADVIIVKSEAKLLTISMIVRYKKLYVYV